MGTSLSSEHAFMVLNALKGIGPITVKRLLEAFEHDVRAIFTASLSDLRAIEGVSRTAVEAILKWPQTFDLSAELEKLSHYKARFLPFVDPEYPGLLKNISDPPIGLYCSGAYAPPARCIAIVGSRRASLYGLQVARSFASTLAKEGFCIVSGLARGIDAAAHEGALSVGGQTLAVLGCGLDVIYPPENKPLYAQIAQQGALLTEFIFGRKGDKQTFPIRNRIIAGLSIAVIVIETDLHGGSIITARLAGEQGREVFAVPGRIDQPTSRGCHQLIRDGATLLTTPEELIEELYSTCQIQLPLSGISASHPKKPLKLAPKAPRPELSELEAKLVSVLQQVGPCSPDCIAEATGLAIEVVSATCLLLEIKQCAAKRLDGLLEAI